MTIGFRYRFLPSGAHLRVMTPSPASYDNWTREQLIARLVELDTPQDVVLTKGKAKARPLKHFDFSSHPIRKIALKFCYSGWEYNGLAFQKGPTPLPTVEEVLFSALAQARLVDPKKGPDGCGWERCGRTDRGVSAAGQVVSLWVRSALTAEANMVSPRPEMEKSSENETYPVSQPEEGPVNESTTGLEGGSDARDDLIETPSSIPTPQGSELRYVSILNRILPPTIRVLAWSPVSPNFSARFATRYRHYKYFFSPHGLDISLMRNACDRLLGEHDFRNLCKLDAAKQITNFKRYILRADISSVSGTAEASENDIYVFDLVGTAFLYHQVRHIMAVLFLIGTGLEHPSVMSALLNVDKENPRSATDNGDSLLEVVDRKPEYQMADGLPLMLWDCVYGDSDVLWRTDGNADVVLHPHELWQSGSGTELYHQLHSIHARSLIHIILESHFLSATEKFHPRPPAYFPLTKTGLNPSSTSNDLGIMKVPLGGGTFRRTAKYVPLLLRKRIDSVEVANERWRLGKGARHPDKGEPAPDIQAVEENGDE
jgi:tRNA pseudouridine38/39 synthase